MDMPHQTVIAELMIEHFSTIFVRYIQAHHISPGASVRRPKRRMDHHVYATVPELIAEVAALNAREDARKETSPPPLPPLHDPRTPPPGSPSTTSRPSSSERVLAYSAGSVGLGGAARDSNYSSVYTIANAIALLPHTTFASSAACTTTP